MCHIIYLFIDMTHEDAMDFKIVLKTFCKHTLLDNFSVIFKYFWFA